MARYYFQELCPHVQEELINQALENAGHDHRIPPASQELMEDIDDYINRSNHLQTIPEWFQTVQGYESWGSRGGVA